MNEQNNLKDTDLSLKDNAISISYKKVNKLITALYMVTDIMDKEEILRNKLRLLGAEMITHINAETPFHTEKKIIEILSFLEIASAMNMISEMNARILSKEFINLKESLNTKNNLQTGVWLENFLAEDALPLNTPREEKSPVRIGVQKGSTLLNALKEIELSDRVSVKDKVVSNRVISIPRPIAKETKEVAPKINHKDTPPTSKNERRYEILKVIKGAPEGISITDIRSKLMGGIAELSEKTLQRELIAMVSEGVLDKSGAKRWSRYSLKN